MEYYLMTADQPSDRELLNKSALHWLTNRKDGNTEWVRVKSLAGEPCRVQAVFTSTPKLRINGDTAQLQSAANGIYDLPLKKDDEALLFVGEPANPLVKPVPMAPWNTVYVNGQQAAIDGTGIVTVNTTTGQNLTFSPTAR